MRLSVQRFIIIGADLICLYPAVTSLMLRGVDSRRAWVGIQVLLIKRKVIPIAAVVIGSGDFQHFLGQKSPVPEGKVPVWIEVIALAAGGTVAQAIKPALLVDRSIVSGRVVIKVVLIDLPDGVKRVMFIQVIVHAKPGARTGIRIGIFTGRIQKIGGVGKDILSFGMTITRVLIISFACAEIDGQVVIAIADIGIAAILAPGAAINIDPPPDAYLSFAGYDIDDAAILICIFGRWVGHDLNLLDHISGKGVQEIL